MAIVFVTELAFKTKLLYKSDTFLVSKRWSALSTATQISKISLRWVSFRQVLRSLVIEMSFLFCDITGHQWLQQSPRRHSWSFVSPASPRFVCHLYLSIYLPTYIRVIIFPSLCVFRRSWCSCPLCRGKPK
jgi:hypothetical protein